MQQLRSINVAVMWCTRRRVQDIIFTINGVPFTDPPTYMLLHEIS